jgi:endoplasmic reticulum junction formation protein lunapark
MQLSSREEPDDCKFSTDLVIQQQPIGPPRKQWYDKLADALLGDDDSVPPTSRYALICQKCFAHNGLVKESLWQDTRQYTISIPFVCIAPLQIHLLPPRNLGYVCPKCGHFNPSQRSLDLGTPAAPKNQSDQSKSKETPPSTSSFTTSPSSLHPTMQAGPQRREPSNNVRKRRPSEPEEGNSTTEMDVDS